MNTITQYINDTERRKKEVIPGTFDLTFKSIFSCEREYLADIVNGITKIPKKIVEEKALIINSEYVIENIEESRKTSDLVIEVENNIINIEMNRSYYEGIIKRNNKYAQKISYMNSNEKTIIQINFDMFNLYKDDRTIIKFEMMDKEKGIVDKNNITKYEVNLELIYKKYYNKEKITDIERKLLIIVLKNRKELKKISKGDEVMEKVNKKIEELSDDKYAWMIYDREERVREEAKLVAEYEAKIKMKQMEKQLRKKIKEESEETKEKIEKETKEKIEKETKEKIEKELAEKLEEVKVKGIEQGIEEGIEKGIIQTAKNMVSKNIDVSLISEMTGLSIEKIELLK